MPTYLYKHTNDLLKEFSSEEHPFEFEVQQSIKDEALKDCPTCGREVQRLIAGSVAVSWKNGSPTPKHYV